MFTYFYTPVWKIVSDDYTSKKYDEFDLLNIRNKATEISKKVLNN